MALKLLHRTLKGQFYPEALSDNITLDMVFIKGGKFTMGSPEDEPERADDEGPQHDVTVPDFFMGKYQVTQAQWQVVSTYPQVNVEMKPSPSNFKGKNLPVEQVSWDEAVEFCDRLSNHSGRSYSLPSEAQWEYACRGGTTTPFAFGHTLSTDLANYDGNYTYADGPKGEYREKTIAVGSFPANAFGLYDMHGNVYEWCLDHWHSNYEGAPIDGSAWIENGSNTDAARVRRGGSWISNPRWCRSASRYGIAAGTRGNDLGFRVVVSALPRISS
jgi:formylglycine-generating enzyme required for sulfatase activity